MILSALMSSQFSKVPVLNGADDIREILWIRKLSWPRCDALRDGKFPFAGRGELTPKLIAQIQSCRPN